MTKDGYVYLAAPYSEGDKTDDLTREKRYWQITAMAAELMKSNIYTYSPITCGHPMSQVGLKRDFKWWLDFDFTFIRDANAVFVIEMEGWQRSPGVKAEIKFARDNNIPVFFLKPDPRVLNKGLDVGGYT